MRFPDPALGEKFRRFDAYCRQAKDAQGHHRPYKSFPRRSARGVYFAEWATFAIEDRNPVNYHGSREVHSLSMSAIYDADGGPEVRDQIVGFTATGRWKPAETGWGARVTYRTLHGADYPRSKRPNEWFKFSVFYYRATDSVELARPTIHFARNGGAQFAYTHLVEVEDEQDPIAYEFVVRIRTDASYDQLKKKQPDEDVDRILGSPEAMRDFGLAALNELENRIRAEIPTKTALRSVRSMRMPEYNEDPDRLNRDRPPRDDELAEVMRIARERVQSRRSALNDGYQEMYAAVHNALPVQQLK
jgi:hypothetical protein